MLQRIRELQEITNRQLEIMAKCEKEKDRQFFFKEYTRIKKELDKEMDEWARGLVNFDIL